jgi:hypothetical protein
MASYGQEILDALSGYRRRFMVEGRSAESVFLTHEEMRALRRWLDSLGPFRAERLGLAKENENGDLLVCGFNIIVTSVIFEAHDRFVFPPADRRGRSTPT